VLSKGSPISNRLWNTIRHLKEVAPKLGLIAGKENSHSQASSQSQQQHLSQPQQLPTPQSTQSQSQSQSQPLAKTETDPSRNAAVAMAGLAGVSVNEMNFSRRGTWTEHSSSPEGMAHDLTSLFEAAGGLQAMGQGHGIGGLVNGAGSQLPVHELSQHAHSGEGAVDGVEGGLTGMLDELF
jgi:hypothetical protein